MNMHSTTEICPGEVIRRFTAEHSRRLFNLAYFLTDIATCICIFLLLSLPYYDLVIFTCSMSFYIMVNLHLFHVLL